MYKCLCTTKSSRDLYDKWKRTVTFHSSPNSSVTYHGTYSVLSTKTDGFYVYDNALNATYYVQKTSPLSFTFDRLFSCNEVIYVEQNRCILMHSQELGYQVWTRTEYLKANKKIPYVCVFFYEGCAGTEKKWVYDWGYCPTHTEKLNKLLQNISP
ncbi:hypothetical protein V5799_032232 [Amblyomma americanum]|uniref:Uncharacterized protein n=1 Tax=Amblyomma americanum TaxID=6943 RepID=A0AAQ4DRS7_AMBAM